LVSIDDTNAVGVGCQHQGGGPDAGSTELGWQFVGNLPGFVHPASELQWTLVDW
jgi:hypothetical protein